MMQTLTQLFHAVLFFAVSKQWIEKMGNNKLKRKLQISEKTESNEVKDTKSESEENSSVSKLILS